MCKPAHLFGDLSLLLRLPPPTITGTDRTSWGGMNQIAYNARHQDDVTRKTLGGKNGKLWCDVRLGIRSLISPNSSVLDTGFVGRKSRGNIANGRESDVKPSSTERKGGRPGLGFLLLLDLVEPPARPCLIREDPRGRPLAGMIGGDCEVERGREGAQCARCPK